MFDSIHLPPIFSNPIKWNCAQLSAWLKQTDLGGFAELLERDEVDGEAFMLLSVDECINTLKIKLGPAMKLESLGKE
uniref:SAM domain-containing protein n=1 Tax=Syphacia muris TaxID=451379 RepID=A0A0N5AV41_9BILA